MAVTGSEEAALETSNLRKSFAAPVLQGLDLEVRRGELFALLGRNGAGKTTSLRIIAGLLEPDSGEVVICGLRRTVDPIEARRPLAWLPDEPMVYDKLTPLEFLQFMAGLWGVPPARTRERSEELLRWLGLWERRGDRCETFSRGMRQKVALAGALVHDPKLLLLDEPLTGLDVESARQVKDFLRTYADAGGAVLLTTHILEVVERLADRIGILHEGRLLAVGTMAELQALAGDRAATLEDLFLALTRSAA
jgi:ABC-2 type transport system ATP-binding protein